MNIRAFSGMSSIKLPDTIKSGKTDLTSAIKNNGNKSHMDSYLDQIKEMARQDAAKGEYNVSRTRSLENSYMKKHISPNRSKMISATNMHMKSIIRANKSGLSILSLFGMGRAETFIMGGKIKRAEIFNANGEMIAARCANSGMWVELPTKAESSFSSLTAITYRDAYRAAKAEMAAAASMDSGSIDVLA